jgi:hypothetical protein
MSEGFFPARKECTILLSYLDPEFFMRVGFQFPIKLSGLVVRVRHDGRSFQSDYLAEVTTECNEEEGNINNSTTTPGCCL